MQTNLIKWFLFFSLNPALVQPRIFWKLNEFALVEKTVKTILESCDEHHESSNPIVIYGNFNENVNQSSIIRMNEPMAFGEDVGAWPFASKAGRVVFIADSPDALENSLDTLLWNEWWDHMAPLVIIAKYTKTCENFREILNTTWAIGMINSIYVCAESTDTPVVYTLNLIANYAPRPWERTEALEDFNVFRQVYDPQISCKNLHYDKTKFLNQHEVRFVRPVMEDEGLVPGRNYCKESADSSKYTFAHIKSLRSISIALNVTCRFEVEIDENEANKRISYGKSDILAKTLFTSSSMGQEGNRLFPHRYTAMIVVIQWSPEVPPLHTVLKFWSTPVLIAAAIALVSLTLILTIKTKDCVLAILILLRLLISIAIPTFNRNHVLRIYFAAILLFTVIINGVFQSKMVTFSIKRERVRAAETLDGLVDSNYKMFISGNYLYGEHKPCEKCDFKMVSSEDCIRYVLINPLHLCVLREAKFYEEYSELQLYRLHQTLNVDYGTYTCRSNWPLKNRFDNMILRFFESGLIDFREKEDISKTKHLAARAEWSTTRYRPISVYKLEFAFQVLAIGLLLSIVAFIFELHEGQ